MADYKSAYSTSLGDYCIVKSLKPNDLEIEVISVVQSALGDAGKAFGLARTEFDRIAERYDDVVDFREGIVSRVPTNHLVALVCPIAHERYQMRGTGIKIKK